MASFDFDFQRYVERRKGARAAERREGTAYAYAPEQRLRRLALGARPVSLALEATVKLWRASARAELLGTAVRATEKSFPRLVGALHRAGEQLHVQAVPLYVSPHASVSIHTLGTDEEPQILVHASLADSLGDGELQFALGSELGRVQNNHVMLCTAHYYLHRAAGKFLGWTVKPAEASLAAWARRAVVTADRAGLLAARDLDAARGAVDKIAAATGDGAQLLPAEARIAALGAFIGGAFYHGVMGQEGGASAADIDALTAQALKRAGKEPA